MNQLELKKILSAKFDFSQWKSLLQDIFGSNVAYFTKEATVDAALIKSGGQVGTIHLDDDRSLAIFKFEVSDSVQIARNRKSLRDIAAKYVDQSLIHGAWVFYYSENQADYRLTYIAKQTSFTEDGELVTKETAPKRYTFLLGENEPCTTAANRLLELFNKRKNGSVYLTDVTEAFSVERLNKDFFTGYNNQYNKFINYFSEVKLNISDKEQRDYVKKLLGRLVFLQFLQKKGWMGVPSSNENWEGGDKNYLANLIDKYPKSDSLLSDVLEPLFFNTLNEARENDLADKKLGENIKIPYLNGGLFDKDRIDKLDVDFPYSYFKELMDFFSMYNFTIDENDPEDSEVGIDPEMLGHIFENLLEDNKDKGAVYTPKEIVQYMCRQSIIEYLQGKLGKHEEIELFINTHRIENRLNKKNFIVIHAKEIEQLLDDVMICDPAIGSGAFPMGILNEIFHAKMALDMTLDRAEVKKSIIQNSIYGVDIEQGAVDIARLRFWLSLVVDEDAPQPLPNLDYKIMCGDSLLNRFALAMPFKDIFREYNKEHKTNYSLADYKAWVTAYTNESNHDEKDLFKEKINRIKKAFRTVLTNEDKQKLIKTRKEIMDLEAPLLFGERTKQEKAELKKLKTKLSKQEKENAAILENKLYENAFEWRFEFPQLLDEDGSFIGFDIVIGNPPYVEAKKLKEISSCLKAKYKTYTGTADLSIYFIELGMNLLRPEGVLSLITTNKFFNTNYGEPVRTNILNYNLSHLINFEQVEVFEGVLVSSVIISINNSNYKTDNNFIHERFYKLKTGEFKKQFSERSNLFGKYNQAKLSTNEWSFSDEKELLVKNTIEENGIPLKHIEGVSVYRGVTTGYNPAFIIDEQKRSELVESDLKNEEVIKKILQGRNIRKWIYNTNNDSLLFIPWHFPLHNEFINGSSELAEQSLSSEFPSLYQHLLNHKDNLSKRNQAETGVRYEWYALQRCAASYYGEFEKQEKIIWGLTADKWAFAYDDQQHYLPSNGYILTSENIPIKYLLALLNSNLLKYYFGFIGVMTAGGAYTLKHGTIQNLPIAQTNNTEVFETLVDYILFLKTTNIVLSELVSNDFIANYIEDVLNGCVYELYFAEHMREKEIDILDDVKKIVLPIGADKDKNEKSKIILTCFNYIKKTDNPIRTRLELFALRSPDFLKPIMQRK